MTRIGEISPGHTVCRTLLVQATSQVHERMQQDLSSTHGSHLTQGSEALVGVVVLHVLVLGDGHGVVAVLGLAPVHDDQAVGVKASSALELGLKQLEFIFPHH